MSVRLQDEVEDAVDQLLRLTLEDVALTAAAADQWLADLNEADSFEQMAAYHRCFLRELQRISAHDLSRRIEIAAAWFGAAPQRMPHAEASAAAVQRQTAPAARTEADWQPFTLDGVATLAGAMLDATNLKHLSALLYGPSPQRWAREEVDRDQGDADLAVDAAAPPRADPAVARNPLAGRVAAV